MELSETQLYVMACLSMPSGVKQVCYALCPYHHECRDNELCVYGTATALERCGVLRGHELRNRDAVRKVEKKLWQYDLIKERRGLINKVVFFSMKGEVRDEDLMWRRHVLRNGKWIVVHICWM